jgi:hypothetical protein
MAIAQGATNTFKIGLLDGNYDLATGNFKIALFTGAASIGPDTTQYTVGMTGEVVASGYTQGGEPLTITQVPTIGNQTGNATAYLSFQNVTWTSALTARGALITTLIPMLQSACWTLAATRHQPQLSRCSSPLLPTQRRSFAFLNRSNHVYHRKIHISRNRFLRGCS